MRSLFTCLTPCLALPLLAVEKPAALPIEQLVTTTLAANPELQFYEAEITAAKAGRVKAGRPANPELSLEVGGKRLSASDAAAEGMAFSASLQQPVEWPGRLGLRKAVANRDITLAQLGLEQFRTHLAGRVRLLAFSLSSQQEMATAAEEVAARYTSLRDVLVQRDPAGIAPQLEMKTIEAATVVAQAKAGDAAVAVQKALLELNQLMGRRADAALEVRRPSFTFNEPPTLARLLGQAMNQHYELLIARAELEQQGFKVALADNERRPAFTVGPFFSQEKAGEKETMAGVSVSVPLPFWNSGRADVDIAEARRMQAQASLNALQRQVERQVTEATLLFHTQHARLTAWKPDALPAFREAAALADRHYRLGAVPVGTYVELQDKYLEATEAIQEAQAQALEAALTLEQLTGAKGSLLKPATAD